MDIAATLRRYDGKRVAPFRTVAEAVRELDAPASALPQLLDLAARDQPALQTGATWVIKHLAEGGTAPTGDQAARVVGLLALPLAPDATLHLLQTLPHMEIPAGHAGSLRRTLLGLIESRRVFVRAWAYTGLGILAARDPTLLAEVERLFDRADRTETPAVRVRIRHARAAL